MQHTHSHLTTGAADNAAPKEENMRRDKVFIIGEIGINHNGDVAIATQLIKGAAKAGADAVKFQKRTVELVYSKEELDKPRESPWGTTNREQKYGLEFGHEQYAKIDDYCKLLGIEWFASAWDIPSLHFLRQFHLKYNKVASALLTNHLFLGEVAQERKYTFISTGMSTMEDIAAAVEIFKKHGCPFELMHCNSTYPMKNEDADLLTILSLKERFQCKVGYSGHETGRIVSLAAASLGATSIERHITLDRSMYGSDQAASIPLNDFERLIADIRAIELAMGDGVKKIRPSEIPIAKKLRGGRVI